MVGPLRVQVVRLKAVTSPQGAMARSLSLSGAGRPYLVPTTAGAAANYAGVSTAADGLTFTLTNAEGTSAPQTATIDRRANTFNCGENQAAAIIALGSAVTDGKTIGLLPNTAYAGPGAGSYLTISAANTFATGLTFSHLDPIRPGNLGRVEGRHNGRINFACKLYDEFDPTSDTSSSSLVQHNQNNPTYDFTGCHGESSNVPNQRFTDESTGIFTAVDGGAGDHTLDLSNAIPAVDLNNLSASATILLQTHQFSTQADAWLIKSVDVANDRITVGPFAKDGTTATPVLPNDGAVDFAIGDIQTLAFFTQAGGTAPTVIAHLGTYRHLASGFAMSRVSGYDIQWNDVDYLVGDWTIVFPRGDETVAKRSNNFLRRFYGRSTDPQNPHVDIDQDSLNALTQQNTVIEEEIGNILAPGGGRSMKLQGSFRNGFVTHRRWVKSCHNLFVTQGGNGYTWDGPAAGSRAFSNGVFREQYDTANGQWGAEFEPTIPEMNADSDLNTVFWDANIVSQMDITNIRARGNHLLGGTQAGHSGAIYAALMDGDTADFDTSTLADKAAVIAAFRSSAGGALYPANRPIIGPISPYYDFDTGVLSSPFDATGMSPAGFTDLADQVASTVVTSNELTLSGLPDEGAVIFATGDGSPEMRLRSAADVTLIDWESAEDNLILGKNGEKITLRATTNATAAATQTITPHFGAVTADWTIQTETNEIAANDIGAVPSTGGNYDIGAVQVR